MNFFGAGPLEVLFVLVIALLVLGPSRLVEASRGLGKLTRQVRRVTEGLPDLLEREATALEQSSVLPHEEGKETRQEPDPGEAFHKGEEGERP